jgi:hypothetical protein
MTLKVSSTKNLPEDILKDIFEFLGIPAVRRVCKQWRACLDARFATLFQNSLTIKAWISPLDLTTDSNNGVMRIVQAVWESLSQSTRVIIQPTPLMLDKALTLEADSNLIIFFTAIWESFPDGTAIPTLTNDLSRDAAAIRIWMKSNQASLDRITRLILPRLSVTALPPEIGLFTNLELLYLGGTQCTRLPSEIGKLTKLKVFNLSFAPITWFPPEMGRLIQLQSLTLYGAQLKWPPFKLIEQLKNLEYCNFGGTSFAFLSCLGPNRLRLLRQLADVFFRIGETIICSLLRRNHNGRYWIPWS